MGNENYYSARTLKKVDEDRVIENSAGALRCSCTDMVLTNITGDRNDKIKLTASNLNEMIV
jgi:hypothetical protein